MAEVLETSVGVFQEGLSRSPGQGAGFQEGFLLFLMFVDELGDQGGSIMITGCVPE